MMFLVSTQNLLLIFVALEFLSLSLYLLTGFDKHRRESAEAALKYFLFGGMSAGFLLFGISLLYGLSNSLDLHEVAASVSGRPLDPLTLIAIVMVAIGFGFPVRSGPVSLLGPGCIPGRFQQPALASFASSSKSPPAFFISRTGFDSLAGARRRRLRLA